jgi:hypothetical protein
MSRRRQGAQSGNAQQVPALSLDQFVPLSNRINWDSLENDPDEIEIDGSHLQNTPYRQAFASLFNPPVHDFILYLPSTRWDEYPPDRMVYHSDQGFRPIDIFGAIYTYYQMPLPRNALEQMVRDGIENADYALRQRTPLRYDIMGSLIHFEGLSQHDDGYQVDLGS